MKMKCSHCKTEILLTGNSLLVEIGMTLIEEDEVVDTSNNHFCGTLCAAAVMASLSDHSLNCGLDLDDVFNARHSDPAYAEGENDGECPPIPAYKPELSEKALGILVVKEAREVLEKS
jgi:hypothetical protein